MSDEVNLGGKTYISSKRASASTGYAQDYIGQLARKGAIDAQRIGGLWYIHLESLTNYKEKAETFVPQPPMHENTAADPDSLVFFDGKDYVSASKASEITGYHPDYVGQLARGGKVVSQQIGNRWYVDRAGILAHKEEKEGWRADMQVESVGLTRRSTTEGLTNGSRPSDYGQGTTTEGTENKIINKTSDKAENNAKLEAEAGPFLTYITDTGILMPNLEKKSIEQLESEQKEEEEFEAQAPGERTTIPIRVDKFKILHEERYSQRRNEVKRAEIPFKHVSYSTKMYTGMAIVSLGVVILVAFGAAKFTQGSASSGGGIFTKVGDILEPLLTREIIYVRKN